MTLIREPREELFGRSMFIMLGLMGTFALLPVQLINLPLQMDVVDVWVVAVLFIFSLAFIAGYQKLNVSIYYLLAMWLILMASLASSFAAIDRIGCLVVVLKEVYLFTMFIAVAALLSRLSTKGFRLVMLVWLGSTVLHGMLIIAEFLIPQVYSFISGLADQPAGYEHFRPSGLFFSPKAGNANKAAVFQMFGFVPLVLSRTSRRTAIALGLLLLSSILATGSMGTTLACITGLFVAVTAIAIFGNNLLYMLNLITRSVFAVAVVGGVLLFLASENQSYQDHFERIFLGRVEKSSEGRFSLWQRGVVALRESDNLLLGIGPENFRDVDVLEKQLHNDLLAFSVERGLLGVLGLLALAGVALSRAIYCLRIGLSDAQDPDLSAVVFLAAFASVLVVSLTHQVFHSREIWLVLASQEALIAHFERDAATDSQANLQTEEKECWGEA